MVKQDYDERQRDAQRRVEERWAKLQAARTHYEDVRTVQLTKTPLPDRDRAEIDAAVVIADERLRIHVRRNL